MPVCAAEQLYSVVAKFCLKSKVQLINIEVAAVFHLGSPCMAEFQTCTLAPSNRYLSAEHIPLQKVCAGTLSEIISK